MLCSEWALVKRTATSAEALPLLCKCWHCDLCRPRRTKRLIEEARAGRPTLFITLTSRRRPGITASQAARDMVEAWRKVRRAFVYKHGKGSIAFLAVFEETKMGWPHLHIVARCKWISHDWLSKKMGKLTDSPNVWLEAITTKSKIANYIAKYIGKNPHRFDGVKRYWRSLDYLFPVAPDEGDEFATEVWWEIVRRHYLEVRQDLAAMGWQERWARPRAPPDAARTN